MITDARNKRFDDVLSARTNNITVVLDGVKNYHNIAAVLRSCDAFGINEAYAYSDQVLEYSSSVSKGSQKWVKLNVFSSTKECIEDLKSKGFKLVSVQSKAESELADLKSVQVHKIDFSQKLAFVYGNEHRGVSPEFQQASDYGAHIDMYGFVESLNISVACAIVLHSSSINREMGYPTPLSQDEINVQKKFWIEREVGKEVPENLLKEYEYKS